MSDAKLMSRWSHTTSRLWYCCVLYAFGSLLFGYDVAMFGSLQALPAFLNQFGENVNGKKALSSHRKSVMNSVVWPGKITGTMLFEPLLERVGYRYIMCIVAVLQIIAVIIEMTAKEWIQFSIGRVIAYLAVGLVENAVPSYTSEICPPEIRPFFSGSVAFLLGVGNLWGNLMGRAYATEKKEKGWLVPTAMQLIPAVIMLLGVFSTQESPRWLISRGRKDEALANLDKLRSQEDVNSGRTVLELEALEQAVVEAASRDDGSWLDLFRGTYLRRSLIAQFLFIFQQTTGGQFINVYGATFYVQMGLGSMSFTYTCISAACGLVAVLSGLFLYANFGRRPILITGAFLQIPFMCIVAGIGGGPRPTEAGTHAVIASIILFSCVEKVSLSTACYIITSEIGGTKMRKKIMSWATSWDVLAAFTVTYSIPYLLGTPGANLGAKVGWIFAGISTLSFLFALFFVPELQGRSLEETDELFEKRLWAWQFAGAKTTGVGARIAAIEAGRTVDGNKGDDVEGGHEQDDKPNAGVYHIEQI